MTTVVTGWTGRNYDALGEQCIRTFDDWWPENVKLVVISDQPSIYCDPYGRMNAWFSFDQCAGLAEFVERHKGNKEAIGRKPNKGWKASEVLAGYSFRFDAVKFATQLFIPLAASKHLPDGEVMVWLDADVLTKREVPEGFVEGLIGDFDIAYLGREPKHSEIGFWAVRLSQKVRDFLECLADQYITDEVFLLQQWHSAFVWDDVRKRFENRFGLRSKNLTPGGDGHVFPISPLKDHLIHLKGKRKLKAWSTRKLAA